MASQNLPCRDMQYEVGQYNSARWAVFDKKPIIKQKKQRFWEKFVQFQIWRMGKLLAASPSTMDLSTPLWFPLCYLMDRSSRTAIFFLASVFRKNFSVTHFLLVLLVSVSTVSSLFQRSMACKPRNPLSYFYVNTYTPIIARECQLAGSSGCLIARSAMIQV